MELLRFCLAYNSRSILLCVIAFASELVEMFPSHKNIEVMFHGVSRCH